MNKILKLIERVHFNFTNKSFMHKENSFWYRIKLSTKCTKPCENGLYFQWHPFVHELKIFVAYMVIFTEIHLSSEHND